MSPRAPILDSTTRLADVNSMMFSGVVHFAVLIALGLFTGATSENWGGIRLLVNAGNGGEPTTVDDGRLDDAVELQVTDDPAAAMGPVELFADVATPTTDFAAIDALADNLANLSGYEGPSSEGKSDDEGASALASTEFFGIGGYGQSFVYVVDCSDSMNEGGKFDRARYELMRSIEQLASDQRYFVIFFNSGAYPMDANELVLATQEQVARTAEWVGYVEAQGGTYPLPALLFALSLRPDAIYFLSDGQFDPITKAQLRYRNRPNHRLGTRPIPIHTIAFMDRATERLMRAIARESGGEYRFVK